MDPFEREREEINKIKERFYVGSTWHIITHRNSIVKVIEIYQDGIVEVMFLQPAAFVGVKISTNTILLRDLPHVGSRNRRRSRSRSGTRIRSRSGTRRRSRSRSGTRR